MSFSLAKTQTYTSFPRSQLRAARVKPSPHSEGRGGTRWALRPCGVLGTAGTPGNSGLTGGVGGKQRAVQSGCTEGACRRNTQGHAGRGPQRAAPCSEGSPTPGTPTPDPSSKGLSHTGPLHPPSPTRASLDTPCAQSPLRPSHLPS